MLVFGYSTRNPSASPTDCVFTLPAPGSPQPPFDRLFSAQQPQRPCLPLKLPPWVPEGLPQRRSLTADICLQAFYELGPHCLYFLTSLPHVGATKGYLLTQDHPGASPRPP